jgi:hypothetical protein
LLVYLIYFPTDVGCNTQNNWTFRRTCMDGRHGRACYL